VSDVEFEPLYQCTVAHILDACCFGEGIQNLMVLAHNPGLEDFLDYAVEDGASVFKQYGGVMPGTMAVLEAVYDGNMLSSRKGKVLDWFSP
jgi:phosphohistidine phosphatase SixA